MRLELQGVLTVADLRYGLRLAAQTQRRLGRGGLRVLPILIGLTALLLNAFLAVVTRSWFVAPFALVSIAFFIPLGVWLYTLHVALPRLCAHDPDKLQFHLILEDEGVFHLVTSSIRRGWERCYGYGEDRHGFVLLFEPSTPSTPGRARAIVQITTIPRRFLSDSQIGELRDFLARLLDGPRQDSADCVSQVVGDLSDMEATEKHRSAKHWTQDLSQLTATGWGLLVLCAAVTVIYFVVADGFEPDFRKLFGDRWHLGRNFGGVAVLIGVYWLGKSLLNWIGLSITRRR